MGGGGNVTVELMIDPVEGAAVPGFQIVFEFIQAPDQSVYFFVRTAPVSYTHLLHAPIKKSVWKKAKSTSPLHPAAAQAVRFIRIRWRQVLLPTV